MFKKIEEILGNFRPCFKREKTFRWFVIAVVGLMCRQDHLGVTSIIRELCLSAGCYELLLHFFHSDAWSLDSVRLIWYGILSRQECLYKVGNRTVLVGDGVKQPKEAFFMPGVKKMVQESETVSKPEYIFGHLFGAVGLLAGDASSPFCIPLKVTIQDGLRAASGWGSDSAPSGESHVLQMIRCGFEAAKAFGPSAILLDRYFLSVPALKLLDNLNAGNGSRLLEIVTKAKRGCTAYLKPEPPKEKHRGRPKKKGDAVKVFKIFGNPDYPFTNAKISMYGDEQDVSYHCVDLLWGQKLYRELRFVLVKWDGMESVLVSTDLSLPATSIIELYGRRVKIEGMFRMMKQQLGAFCYHFWTKALPKLNHFSTKETPDPLSLVTVGKNRKRILGCVKAIEGFMLCSTIAMGILQLVSISGDGKDDIVRFRYLRTQTKGQPSESTVAYYLSRNIFRVMRLNPDSFVTRFINDAQTRNCGVSRDKTA